MILRHVLLLTLCLALCAGVAFHFLAGPKMSQAAWVYTDLRLLDAADADQTTLDLLAVYTRNMGDELQIRLDMLEHAATPDYDLYLALDTQAGGSRSLPIAAQANLDWDWLLVIPASGEMQALDSNMRPKSGAGLRVIRDPVLDQVQISLIQTEPHGQHPNVQVFIVPAGKEQISDQTDPIRWGDAQPPPARVWLAFWNTFPAYTPASALRRWNGAHTGPLGGSHGLLHLLRTARAEGAPLALLDLKYPASLSALDFSGGLGLVQGMAGEGWLILPEYLPDPGQMAGDPAQWLKRPGEMIQQVGERFGLSPSKMGFTQPTYFSPTTEFDLLFADLTHSTAQPGRLEPTLMWRWGNQRALPIRRYAGQETQAQDDGPSLEVRRALSRTALAAAQPGGETKVLVLGGSLPESAWGSPGAAKATMHYIKSRPWIQLMDARDLLAMPATVDADIQTAQADAGQFSATQDSQALLEALHRAPDNALGEAAWQAYLALNAPTYPAPVELNALRANYSGQVWSLLAAARWLEHPAPMASCAADLDQDEEAECVLASDQLYAQFESQSGALIYLFQRDPGGGGHQIIGPSSQVISGLSDPQSWKLNDGLTADPAVIAGAFAETGMNYQPVLAGERLTFTTADRSSQKTYLLLPDGLRLIYRAGQAKTLQMPLLLDPWRRFAPGWSAGYGQSRQPFGWTARLESESASPIQVEIYSNTAISAENFNEAAGLIQRAENPNQDYPPGFFLPFAVTEIRLDTLPGQDTIIELTIQP
jgi:hypothetical protein